MSGESVGSATLSPPCIRRSLATRANEIGLIVAIIVLYAVLAFSAPNFLTAGNQLNILRDAAFVGIIAWGMTFVLIAGEIDISVGPHVAFAGIVLAKLAMLVAAVIDLVGYF